MHKHHINPIHNGGDLKGPTIKVTIKEHALIHHNLWQLNGKHEDYIAWKCLSGQISKEEYIIERSRLGGKISGGWNKGLTKKDHPTLAHTEESKKEQSKRTSGKGNSMYGKKGKDNPNFGQMRPEHSKKMRGRSYYNDGVNEICIFGLPPSNFILGRLRTGYRAGRFKKERIPWNKGI
jgi:hypothetical protein